MVEGLGQEFHPIPVSLTTASPGIPFKDSRKEQTIQLMSLMSALHPVLIMLGPKNIQKPALHSSTLSRNGSAMHGGGFSFVHPPSLSFSPVRPASPSVPRLKGSMTSIFIRSGRPPTWSRDVGNSATSRLQRLGAPSRLGKWHEPRVTVRKIDSEWLPQVFSTTLLMIRSRKSGTCRGEAFTWNEAKAPPQAPGSSLFFACFLWPHPSTQSVFLNLHDAQVPGIAAFFTHSKDQRRSTRHRARKQQYCAFGDFL